MTLDGDNRTLTSWWNPPSPTGQINAVSAGAPIACIATTYTFDAAFFEVELLPRFLGMKFDHTEREISFLVEREQALGTARAHVMVDHTCVDPKQTTLRWDQMGVRVPGGDQHAKIVVLVWERWLRIIISSANLTRQGYRRNREIAGVLDFFDGDESTPVRAAKDVLDFLKEVAEAGWIQAHEAAHKRLISTLGFVRSRLSRWHQAPADFSPRELPRVSFVGGYPAANGRGMLSVMNQVAGFWNTRKATDVAVMTPFVGATEKGMGRLIQRLLDLSRRSSDSVRTYLAIPGHPSQEAGSKKIICDLPSFFRDVWNESWDEIQDGPSIYVVPLVRKGEKINRILHAKALSLSDGERDLLLCGSSNFTPHGMGVEVANVEANLCYQDEARARDPLDARLPVRWYENDSDYCDDVFWPPKVDPPEDESPKQPPAPSVFRAVTFNEQSAKLTVFFDSAHPLPIIWSLSHPGARANDQSAILLDSTQMKVIPPDGRFTLEIPISLHGLILTCVRIAWTDDRGQNQSAWLSVQTESLDDLLPPEEFRGLTSDYIMNCLISGREPAELVDDEDGGSGHISSREDLSRAYDPLRDIDTTGYTLYQVRKLGQTLAALAERLLGTVRTHEAVTYRLNQDPLGPVALAHALAKDLAAEGQPSEIAQMRSYQLVFSFAEIALTLAHACRRLSADRNPGDHDVRPVYRKIIKDLLEKADSGDVAARGIGSLTDYIGAVRAKCDELVGAGD